MRNRIKLISCLICLFMLSSLLSPSLTPIVSASTAITLNPADCGSGITLSNGNLTATAPTSGSNFQIVRATEGKSSGKWYFEVQPTGSRFGYNYVMAIGVCTSNVSLATNYKPSGAYWMADSRNAMSLNGVETSVTCGFNTGDTVGVALDMDNKTITFYTNGVQQGSVYTIASGTYYPVLMFYGTGYPCSGTMNFGNTNFKYAIPSGYSAYELPIPVTGVSLDKTTDTIGIGSSDQLTATVLPTNADNQAVTWASSNPSIAEVDAYGKVTALAEGSATITVTTQEGSFSNTCDITAVIVPATGISLNKTNAILGVGGSEQLTATVLPTNASNKNVIWASSKPSVGTVDANGQVSAIKSGNTVITATTEDGGYQAACNLSVTAVTLDPNNVSSGAILSLSNGNLTVNYKNGCIILATQSKTAGKWYWEVACDAVSNPNTYTTHIGISSIANESPIELGAGSHSIGWDTNDIWYNNQQIASGKLDTGDIIGIALDLDSHSISFYKNSNLNATLSLLSYPIGSPVFPAVGGNGSCNDTNTFNFGASSFRYAIPEGYTPYAYEPGDLITNITLNKTTDSIHVGDTDQLTATITPDCALNQTLNWSSSDNSVATVDASGLITAISSGTTTITAAAADGSGKTATCIVDVTIPVTSISLDKNSLDMVVGNSSTLIATVLPDEATNKAISWATNDSNIATVDSNGLISAVAPGSAVITVKTEDGGLEAICNIVISAPVIPVTSISLNKSNFELNIGASETLIATVLPATASNKNVSWTSDSPAIATVDSSGKVDGIAAGDAVITVKTEDGTFEATCNVKVVNPIISVSSVSLNKNNLELTPGANETLIATVLPEDSTNKNVTWSTSDASIVSVDANGLVSAVSGGSTVIKVKTEDGGYESTCNVQVVIPVKSISLNKEVLDLSPGETDSLVATILPNEATNKAVIWSTSNSNIVTVDPNGLLTAIASGSAVITVKTVDGNIEATCNITVKTPAISVESISLNKNNLELNPGNSETLIVTVLPNEATNKTAIWTTSNPAVVSVDNGLISAVSGGEAVVSVKTEDGGFEALCSVKVNVPVESVVLNKASLEMNIGDSETLTATVLPESSTNKNVSWATSNPAVVSVDNGNVSAISAGSATITVTTENGGYAATCEITVIAGPVGPVPVESVVLNKTSIELFPGDIETLVATVLPESSTNKNVIWASDKSDIASVDNTGAIMALKAGSAVISVTTEDGNKTALCNIKVLPAVNNIIGPEMINLAAGREQTITVTARLADGRIIDVSDRAELTIEDPTIARLDDLTIIGLKPGSTNLLTTFEEKTDKTLITVQGSVMQSLTISPAVINLQTGKMSDVIVVKAIKSNGEEEVIDNSKVQFSIGNTTIAGLTSDYRIIAKTTGNTNLIAQCNGLKAQAIITVTEAPPISVELLVNPSQINCTVGSVITLKVTANGADVTNKATFSGACSTFDIPIVGNVLGLAAGTGNLEVSYGGQTVIIPVSVTDASTDNNTMYVGNAKIILTSSICNNSNVTFTITSSDPSIAKVSANRVFALKPGNVTITVSYTNKKTGIQTSYMFPIQIVQQPINAK